MTKGLYLWEHKREVNLQVGNLRSLFHQMSRQCIILALHHSVETVVATIQRWEQAWPVQGRPRHCHLTPILGKSKEQWRKSGLRLWIPDSLTEKYESSLSDWIPCSFSLWIKISSNTFKQMCTGIQVNSWLPN